MYKKVIMLLLLLTSPTNYVGSEILVSEVSETSGVLIENDKGNLEASNSERNVENILSEQ